MPKKVRTLVDLEALLNDGTAYVLFKLLQVPFCPSLAFFTTNKCVIFAVCFSHSPPPSPSPFIARPTAYLLLDVISR